MAGIYSAQFTNVGVTVAQDFFGISSPTSGSGILLACFISQTTETGDSEEEMLHWYIKTGATTVGSGGSDPANVPTRLGMPAATADARANDTTEASAGTIVTHHSETFNIRVGLQYMPIPELRIWWGELAAGTTTHLEVGLTTVPADSITMSGVVYWEETG